MSFALGNFFIKSNICVIIANNINDNRAYSDAQHTQRWSQSL